MSGTLIPRVLSARAQLGLDSSQVRKLENLAETDKSLATQGASLEAVRGEMRALSATDPSAHAALSALKEKESALESQLRADASALSEHVGRILGSEFRADQFLPELEESVIETPLVVAPDPGAGTWYSTIYIELNTDNGIDTRCKRYEGEFRVPYCFVVDTSRGEAGGYTLEVIREQKVREQRVEHLIDEHGSHLHVGYRVYVRVCSDPYWGGRGRYAANFTLYGRSI